MKIKFMNLVIGFILSTLLTELFAEEYFPNYPQGINLKYGIGNYSHIDEYISKEKYSGTFPFLSVSWAKDHQRYVYKLALDYRYSKNIKNYTISTAVTQFSFNQGFIYPLKQRSLFNRELYLWMGPFTDLLFFYNKPDIAVSGFDYSQSFAILFSAALNTEAVLPLNKFLQLESAFKFSVLSLAGRIVDSEEDDAQPFKLLTLFSGLNTNFDLGIRYFLSRKISLNIAYRSEITRISAWEPLNSVSDNITIGLTGKF
ncbi:hypothetical protein ACFLYJ_00865 [Candidatus Cloacimonadota bacterium]